ncbi:beta-ketoacyl-ACP synthase 3 [Parafrankia sp. EUN1f]|uniref:beta-ketoacyl-ACP synthase 3 n=1 Tax=Parafrankia sp. EUN1f TaxID=102897 RepID=UPI0001C451EB|nr:beta-ketoacyl-ACP synthase 3 [Parafrankia sp. EUN1f]EFC82822.1 3-oxoacyl-(acyl-carrier-protein) synthase III [Parafrankia sp. EUN1f]
MADGVRHAARPTGTRLLGLGAYRPAQLITSEELGHRFGRTAQWIESRTGFATRRVATADETVPSMATVAAQEAVHDSQVSAAEIDLVIAATCSTDGTGGVAAEVAAALGAPHAGALDLNAACAGFCYAVAAASDAVRAGSARHVVVVASEKMTARVDPDDLGTSIIFGDGAGAAVIGPGGDDAIGPVVWGHDGSQSSLIRIDETTGRLRMEGQAVFRWAVSTALDVALAACARAGISPADLAAFVPHQANLRIVDAVAAKIGATSAVVARDGADCGNTSAASIPLALHGLRRQRAVAAGDLALLVGFGAGLSWAAQVVRMP